MLRSLLSFLSSILFEGIILLLFCTVVLGVVLFTLANPSFRLSQLFIVDLYYNINYFCNLIVLYTQYSKQWLDTYMKSEKMRGG